MSEPYSCEKQYIGNFGHPVWENPTEHMVNAAFAHHGLRWQYVTYEVPADNLRAAFEGVKALGYRGFNCTLPHKVAILEHLDGLGASAEVIGAVNCVVRRDGRYIGENTDGKGFLESLRPVIDPSGRKVLVLGAGGAARAVSVELALAGATELQIVNRSEERGRELAALLEEKTDASASFTAWRGDHAIPDDVDVVVQATSIGLYPDQTRVAVDATTLREGLVVADVIPNPPKTGLLKEAEAAGCRTIDGLGMLVNQGRVAIEYWTGVLPDAAVMRASLEELFG